MEIYYNDLIGIWDKGGGWGGIYYGIFSNIIKENDSWNIYVFWNTKKPKILKKTNNKKNDEKL